MQAHHQKAAIQKLENDAFNYRGAKFLVLENVGGQRYMLSALMGSLQVPSSQICFSASYGAIDSQAYDFVMIDTALNDFNGARSVSDVRNRFPGATLLVLMNAHELTTATELLEAGVNDILVKEEFTPLQLHTTLLSTFKYGENMGQHRGYTDFQNMRNFYDATWEWNLDTNEMSWGDGFSKTFGYEQSDQVVTFSKWSKMIHPADRDEVLSSLYGAISGSDDQWEMEYRFLRADGKYADVKDKGILLRDDSGISFRMVGVMEDISLRIKENQRLKLMESVIDHSSDGVLMAEEIKGSAQTLEVVYANDAFINLTDYSLSDIKGKSPWLTLQWDGNEKAKAKLEKALGAQAECNLETTGHRKDGSSFWAKINVKPVEYENGKVTHWVTFMRDGTDQKNKEVEETLFASLSHELNVPGDAEKRMEKLLKRICDFSGYQIGELWLTSRDQLHLHKLAAHAHRQADNGSTRRTDVMKFGEGLPGKAWEKGHQVEWQLSGEAMAANPSLSNLPQNLTKAYAIPVIHDDHVVAVLQFFAENNEKDATCNRHIFNEISKRLGAEFQRLKLEEELNRFFNLSPDLLCIAGMDGYLKKINPAFSELLGYSEEEMLSEPYLSFIYREDRQELKHLADNIFSRQTAMNFENRVVSKDGSIKWMAWTIIPIPEERLFYGVAKEITEKKESEQIIGKVNKQLKTAQRIARIGYWTYDIKKNVAEWSEEMFDIWERQTDHFQPSIRNFLMTLHPDDRNLLLETAKHALGTEKHFDHEHRIITPDGKVKWILERITIHRDENQETYLMEGIAQDVTERIQHIKAIEEQNQRLRNIAWTQSHVVRAPLARIMGLTQFINEQKNMNESDRNYSLDNIWKSAKELDSTIHNMIKDAEELDLGVE